MYARAVEDAARELCDLRIEERGGMVLALVVLGASVGSTQVMPPLALPLFAGGVYVLLCTMRAVVRRTDLLEALAAERSAYTIPEVASRGRRHVTMTSRRRMASSLRSSLRSSGALSDRVADYRNMIEALAIELERDDLDLDPTSASVCRRLVTNDGESPLFSAGVAEEDLLSRLYRVRAGFSRRRDGSTGRIS